MSEGRGVLPADLRGGQQAGAGGAAVQGPDRKGGGLTEGGE